MKVVKPKSKKLWVIVAVVVVAALVVAGLILHHNHQVNTAAKKAANKNGYTSPTSKSKSKPASNPGGSAGQGGAIDKKGQATTQAPASNWITSSSGVITVKSPAANSTVSSGTTLSGTASVNTVYFRVIDNVAGEVAQGSLSVVNNNFAGTLNFRSQSNSGRLDVFSYDSNGAEINEVQIPIGLK